MSLRGSLLVATQTVWSSGVGASVGLEAGYTQLASGLASRIGQAFRLRRANLRLLVGCAAALTMTFIALESTGNLALTAAVLVAVVVAVVATREAFGYSFATWRFHLRGETIRSVADIGWMRDLTVGRMMRHDVRTASADMPVSARSRLLMSPKRKRLRWWTIRRHAASSASSPRRMRCAPIPKNRSCAGASFWVRRSACSDQDMRHAGHIISVPSGQGSPR
jgi:hypothetical protein